MQVDTGDDGDGDYDDGGDGDHGDDGDGDHDGYEDVGVCSAETVGMECLHKLGLRIPRVRSAITLCIFQTKVIINFSTLFSDAYCLIPFFNASMVVRLFGA